MARRTSGLVLLLSLCCAAPGRAERPAEEPAPEPEPKWSFPISHDPPGTGGSSAGSGPLYVPGSSLAAPFADPATDAYDPVTRPWALPLARLLDADGLATAEPQRLGEGRQDWLTPELVLPPGRALRQQTEGPFGSVTAEVSWHDPHQAPGLDTPWKADHAWRLPVLGPVFVFGQFGAAPDPVTTDELKMQGKTGVGCKIPVPYGIEVQLRGGPSLSYGDPPGPNGTGVALSELYVELKCHCPLPGQLGLDYQGSAVPALSPLERDRINQDLGLALPVGDTGTLRLGAKHQWESTPTPKPWRDGMQLYVGFELGGGTKKQ